MGPRWHEHPAHINTYADNLENNKQHSKNTGKINDNSPRWTSAASERAQRAKRAERSGTLGELCDPKPFQEASFRKSERAQRPKRAERSGALGRLCDPKPLQEVRFKKQKNKRRFPFHVKSGLCWGWFCDPRRLRKSEKSIGFIRFSATFRC